MKRTLSKSLAILMMVFITLILWGSTAKAAGASIGVSKSTVTEGESITVTVNFGEMVKSAQMIFSFNSTNLEYKGSNGTYNPATKKYAAFSMGGDTLSTATFTFIAKAAGSVSFSFSNLEVQSTEKGRFTPSISSSSAFVTVKGKEDSGSNSGNNSGSNSGNNSGNNSGSNSGTDTKPNGGNTTTKPNNNNDKKPTFSSVNQKVYATETVSIRDSWSTSGKLLGTLKKEASITRTGIGSNGWDRVNYNGRTAYISHTYLTTTKPKEKDDKKDDDKNNTTNEVSNNTTTNEVNNTTNNETNNNTTNDITNNQTNEATNTQTQDNTEPEKKGLNINTIEIIIIAVIVLAIVVIIINEVLAKKREEKRRAAKKREEKRMKGSGR